jgi:hypothetical protein
MDENIFSITEYTSWTVIGGGVLSIKFSWILIWNVFTEVLIFLEKTSDIWVIDKNYVHKIH